MSAPAASAQSTVVPAAQPLLASARRALAALADAGAPVAAETRDRLTALDAAPDAEVLAGLDELLGPLTLLELSIDERGLITPTRGGAAPELVQHGWRSFLVKVANPHRCTEELVLLGPSGLLGLTDTRSLSPTAHVPDRARYEPFIRDGGIVAELPEPRRLSGLEVEYRVIHVAARDAGRQETSVIVTTNPLEGFKLTLRPHDASHPIRIAFEVTPSAWVQLDVREADGSTCMAAIRISDDRDRVYPSRALRLAPDMAFQDHVYRAAGEMVRLPAGDYTFATKRGPETRLATRRMTVDADTTRVELRVDRWIDATAHGYYSGDAHVHAGGCAHYAQPTEGVTPATIVRQIRGEGLNVANILTWGPCFVFQKQFFTGESVSPPADLELPGIQQLQGMTWEPQPTDHDGEASIRYDLEISQFPSGHSGHLILVGLKDQDYPGAAEVKDWPSWTLPILRWASAQGATVGYAHCGDAMGVDSRELPNIEIPRFSGVGANAALVDVANGIQLFLAAAEHPPVLELNLWYHLMNVGYRVYMLGETDYPCLSDQHAGAGRSYLRLPEPPAGPTAVEDWLAGISRGPSYFGDGRSHLFDVSVDGSTELDQEHPAGVRRVSATVAGWLEPEPEPVEPWLPNMVPDVLAAWHLENARIPGTRDVEVELVVNGFPVDRRTVTADGTEQPIEFEVDLPRSSWIALRILPSSHSQPIFVHVDGAPIRASRTSAHWLRTCVDAVWDARSGFIRDSELDDARVAYDIAREVYDRLIEECPD